MAEGRSTGGYNYHFLDNDLPGEFICTICTYIACDPQQVSCCHKIFCKTCLQELSRSTRPFKPKCPLCNVKRFTAFSDGLRNRKIMDLKVYCTNIEEGCNWQGTVTSIVTHLNRCPYQLVRCSNDCGEQIRRMSLEMHLMDSCTQRLVTCQHCHRRGRFYLITGSSHLDECPSFPIQCSNEGCPEKIPRLSLASHNETCPKALVPCDYNIVGCNARIKRAEQDKHDDTSMREHLKLTRDWAINKIEFLESRITQIGDQFT